MKTIHTSLGKLLVIVLMTASIGLASKAPIAHAQSTTIPCTMLSYNLSYGQYDSTVVSLQNFLAAKGYFSHTSTGYFGPLTLRAVLAFQASYGIPRTGFVGPITRGQIQSMSCNGIPIPTPVPVPNPISIWSTNPTAGPIGTTVTLTGTGFTSNNSVFFGTGVVANVPANGNTLTFTIPSYVAPYCPPGAMCPMYMQTITPGTYSFHINNENGTSNAMSFTVTSGTTNGSISISGIDAPSSIPVGNQGTWTVRTSNNTSGTLHYSVVWGDEPFYANGNIMAPAPTNTQSFATFTHAYARTGTYTPLFTVADDYGHTATVSANVLITPIY